MSDETTLRECPFCGGEADEYEGDYGNGIYCMMCGAMVGEPIHLGYRTMERVSIDEAISAWNSRAPIEYDGWFYLPKPKEGIVDYGEPEITRTENGYKVRQMVDVVDEAARKWGEELGEYVMRRICEIWNSRAERTCRNLDKHHNIMFKCSECGHWECQDFDGEKILPQTWNYCPNCGRRVVE